MKQRPRGEPPPHNTGLSDAQLEALLTDFFRQELPEDKRPFAAVRGRRPSSIGASSRPRAVTVAGVVAVTAALLLACSLLFSPPAVVRDSALPNHSLADSRNTKPHAVHAIPTRESADTSGRPRPVSPSSKTRSGTFEPSSVDPPSVPIEYAVIERVEPIERVSYETTDGRVEQRTDIRTTNVSVYEPESGAQFDLMLSELTIEVVPVKER